MNQDAKMFALITFQRICGLSDVLVDKHAKKVNIELGNEILRMIERAERAENVEIVFLDDVRRIINRLKRNGLGALRIDKNFRIIVDYNDTEIKLSPLCKAIYVLYMRHPEGLGRKQIAEKNIVEELYQIYAILAPNKTSVQIKNTIDNLVDFSKKNLDKQMSLINKTVRTTLGDKSEHYLPRSSKRNEKRMLDFENVAFCLPQALNDLEIKIADT